VKKKILIAVAVLVVAGGLIGLTVMRAQSGYTKVIAGQVVRQNLASTVSGTGQIKPKTYVNVGATAFGRITHLYVKEGDHVKAGTVLAKVESVQPEATIAAQQAVPFARTAGTSVRQGADGALATDLTPEEALEYRATLQAHGLDTIFLAAPTSTDARLAQIGAASSGFLYVISRAGVTGERSELPTELPALIRRARKFTTLPIAVGFGISLPTHVTVLGGIADAAVVGSVLMAEIEKAASPDAAATAVAERIRLLKSAARTGVSRRSSEAS